eukprot:CFRG3457T1
MREELYTKLFEQIHDRDGLRDLAKQYRVSYNTLLSIYAMKYKEYTRHTIRKHRQTEVAAMYLNEYESRRNETEESVFLYISEKYSIAPILLARILLHELFRKENGSIQGEAELNNRITQSIRTPSSISDPRLSHEIAQCVAFDDIYSPLVQKVRQDIGLEYEYELQENLHNLGITFKGEEELKREKFPKTPDVLLDVPVCTGTHVVSWIESKASFGDRYTHSINLDQFYAYVNRYGPGLVIYWFGFIDELDNEETRKSGILIQSKFPANIIQLSSE